MADILHLPTEILCLIAVELSPDHEPGLDDSADNRRKRNIARREHLARLAGTCRRFYDIANPILWTRYWKKAVWFSAVYGRHAIIDFLADNQPRLRLEGLDAGANCFDYRFSDTEVDQWDTYDEHCMYHKEDEYYPQRYPAIIAAVLDWDHCDKKDHAATVKYLIAKGGASLYVPVQNYCECSYDLEMPILHTLLSLCRETHALEGHSEAKYEIWNHVLRDIPDLDLSRAYWGPGLLWEVVTYDQLLDPKHLPDIIDLLTSRYGLDVNRYGRDVDPFTTTSTTPLHQMIWSYPERTCLDPNCDVLLGIISQLFRLGADPSLPSEADMTRPYRDQQFIQSFTAMGILLQRWYLGQGKTHCDRGYNWPLAKLLLSNGARCHFDGNWENPGLYDFATFMCTLEGACKDLDEDMLRVLVDDLAPTLHQEGLFTPKLWGKFKEVRPHFRDEVPPLYDDEYTKPEWFTARGVDANWAAFFAEGAKGWEKWRTNSTKEWVEGVSLLAKLPFDAGDA